MADGRELVYFDDADKGRIAQPDLRALEPTSTRSEMRRDPLAGDWVTIASHRQTRTFLPSSDNCPLCPGRGEIPAYQYDVAVFENRWPSFQTTGSSEDATAVRRPAVGRCEVIAFTDEHERSFCELGPVRVRTVIDAWADRSDVLLRHPEISYVACFENRGEAIGVTLHHPHGQIYGYPFVPPVVETMVQQVREYRSETSEDLFTRVLDDELAGQCIIDADDSWVAYVPNAARWPFEVYLMPRQHVSRLDHLDEGQRRSLAELMPRVLGAFDRLFDHPVPYIGSWRQSPTGEDLVRTHWRVFSSQRDAGKLKYLAGSESAYGSYINDISPESAARTLRRALQT